MSVVATRSTWDSHAACRGPNSALFFPPTRRELPYRRELREQAARLICSQCPVRRECLEYALRVPEQFGVWGGCNEEERRQLSAVTAS